MYVFSARGSIVLQTVGVTFPQRPQGWGPGRPRILLQPEQAQLLIRLRLGVSLSAPGC